MPKHITCPLSSEDCQRIKRNLIFLKENLEQYEIRDAFVDEGLWDVCDLEKIDAEKTSNEKNEIFLRLLLESGPTAYEVFTAALQKNAVCHIVERLENTPVSKNFPEPSGMHYFLHIKKQVLYRSIDKKDSLDIAFKIYL